MPLFQAFLGLGFRSTDFLPGIRKGNTTGEDHEKHKQNDKSIIARYGDRKNALAGVCG
jgi:hypothetical protein